MNFSAAYNNNSFNLSESAQEDWLLVEIMAMCMLVIIQEKGGIIVSVLI
jgi:hypothetical protein